MIKLRPMNAAEFAIWRDRSKAEYAREKARSGLSAEDAAAVADKSFTTLLPDHEKTANHFLYVAVAEPSGERIGNLWWGLMAEGSGQLPWIYDIIVEPTLRGKGYGEAIMWAAEQDVMAKGYDQLGLHVFGHNEVARRLYEKLNFQTTSYVMRKRLGQA